jgi:hypothetical protein
MKMFLRSLSPPESSRKTTAVVLLTGMWLLGFAGLVSAQEQAKPTSGALTVEDVVTMIKSGLNEDLVIAAIKSKGKPFDLNAAEIVQLKNSGVSQTVIGYMLDPSKPYAPPARPLDTAVSPPAPAASVTPSDPVAAKTPPQAGIYHLSETGAFFPLDLHSVVPARQGGKSSKLFGLMKGHIVGSIVETKAEKRFPAQDEYVFVLRLPEKGLIDDYALLRLEAAQGRRNLDFGTTPGKPVFPFEARVAYQSKQLAPGIFRLSFRLSQKGEYLFFILGSGDDAKGILGKGYDFGVDEVSKSPRGINDRQSSASDPP